MATSFRVSTSALNLRAGPGVGQAIVAVLLEGALLSDTGESPVTIDGGVWIHVVDERGRAGWVHKGFVTESEAPAVERFRVTAGSLNLRIEPDPESTILAVLQRGATLTATDRDAVSLAEGGRWLNVVTADDAEGWVNARFVVSATVGGSPGDGEGLAWGAKVSEEFRDRVRQIATNLEFDPDLLMAAIAFESGGTFSASVRNPVSGATGLIQFMSTTATGLGTSVEALAAMTPEAQLDFVERYLRPFRGRIGSVEDLYMSILFPVAVGKSSDSVLFEQGTLAYTQNAGLDGDRDGRVTKREASRRVIELLDEGRLAANRA